MKVSCLLPLLALFASCSLRPTLTGKVWSLVDVAAPLIEGGSTTPDHGDEGSFLRFYDDSSFTGRILGRFRYGKWRMDRHQLLLSTAEGAQFSYKVVSLRGDNLVLHMAEEEHPMSVNLHFEAAPVAADKTQDAYSLENNRWEIPARHAEADARILARVRNHLRCELLYIQNAIDKKEEYLSVSAFTSPLAFYGNGMGLKPEAKVPIEWTRLFYDSADASRAYEALKNGFNADMQLPNTRHTFFLYKSILEQLSEKVYLDTTRILITPASKP